MVSRGARVLDDVRPSGERRGFVASGRILLLVAVSAIAAAVWFANRAETTTIDAAFAESRTGQRMLTAMLDQQTGLRGFALTQEEGFLEPYHRGRKEFDDAVADGRTGARARVRARIAEQAVVAREWQAMAEDEIDAIRAGGGRDLAGTEERRHVFDRFRALNQRVQDDLLAQKDEDLQRAAYVSLSLVLGISMFFALLGYVTIERVARRNRRRRERDREVRAAQAEFGEGLQVMRDEREAYGLVRRHLERALPGAEVTIIKRNNSDNRLVSATPGVGDTALGAAMAGGPDSCLAVRTGRAQARGAGHQPLLGCELCGKQPGEVTCVPSLVGGEVIGSVLVTSARPLRFDDHERIAESVAQAAPVLANLRTLALAETRAATDALTGLPNARSCRDTLKRMVAHAARSMSPLSAVLLDLDHFKQINDRFGHGAGDDVLAATGGVLAAQVRASDFAGRAGGEEFLLLLPDTDQKSAMEVAERVRGAIAKIDVARVERAITASLGVATFPSDGGDGDTLLRQADRALYAAKAAGRDRVEVATGGPLAVAAPALTAPS